MSIFDPPPDPAVFKVHRGYFNDSLTVGGAGVSNVIDKHDCATPDAAKALAAHLTSLGLAPALTLDWPLGNFAPGSPLAQSAKVPYLDFPILPGAYDSNNPATFHHRNAGRLLADYEFYDFAFCNQLMVQRFGGPQ